MNKEPKVSPLDWPRHSGKTDEFYAVFAERKAYHRQRKLRRAATAIALLAIAFTGYWFVAPKRAGVMPPEVAILAPREQDLPDGTRIVLREGAAVKIDYAGTLRRVTLEKGEAHFQVAKDKARPFVVSAGGVEVTAVGTAFSVQLGRKSVDVFVNEGRVAVAAEAKSRPAAPTAPLYLEAGHRTSVDVEAPGETIATSVEVAPQESADLLAWKSPRMDLRGTPLAQALEVLNQHVSPRLKLEDPALGNLRISGVLRADNAEALLQLLDSNFGIAAFPTADGSVILRKTR